MKKLLALMLAVAMLFSLTACSLVDEIVYGIQDFIEGRDDDRGNDPVEKDEPDDSSTPVQKPEDTPSTSVPIIPDTPVEKKEYTRGIIRGSNFESSFIGMGLHLPDGWEFYDEEYMRALNNAAADLVGEDFEKLLKNANIIYEMMAADSVNGLDNININLEKLTAQQQKTLDVAENYDLILPTMKAMLENAGYTIGSMKITEVTVDGKVLPAMVTQAQAGELSMQQICFAFVCGEYLVNFTVTAYHEADGAYAILDNFYFL